MPLAMPMQDLKGNASRWLNQHGSAFAWQEGYAAFSLSASNKRAVMEYIAEQPRHHEKRSFEQEIRDDVTEIGDRLRSAVHLWLIVPCPEALEIIGTCLPSDESLGFLIPSRRAGLTQWRVRPSRPLMI